jgi:pimeloyl-ACP methyl ester carboxylesterase
MSDVEPFLFAGERLFGCLHPAPGAPRETGAVLVPPLFGELVQHHRAFYVLAEELAATGVPALRYDHAGTGDSAGDLTEASIGGWVDDVGEAVRALVERAGVARIHLIGARLGAALALAAAPSIGRTAGLALWEPALGAEHLAELEAVDARVLAPYIESAATPAAGPRDLLGFEIPAPLWREIEALAPRPEALSPDLPVAVFASATTLSRWPAPAGFERWTAEEVRHPRGWLDPEEGLYDVLVPAGVVRRIVARVGEGA